MKKLVFVMAIACLAEVSASAQTLFCLEDNYYSKRMVKVFASAKENKLEKVEKYWQDIEEKAAKDKKMPQEQEVSRLLFPVWQLSQCWVMNTKEGRDKGEVKTPFDPWKAYDLLSSVTMNLPDVRNADVFLSNKDIELSVAFIKMKIEANLIEATSAIGTENAYDRLINTLYDYANINQLIHAREEVAFKEIIKTTQVNECVRYLEKYKDINRNHLSQMEFRRDSLAFVQMDATAKACKQYLTDYPKSQFKDDVTKKLHKYEFNEMAHTEAACENYLKQYPSSEYANKVKELKVDYAFKEAKAENSLNAFHSFLKKYGASVYANEAVGLMEKALNKRYYNRNIAIYDLEKYISNQDKIEKVDDSRIHALYTNMLIMPTSALMMENRGLVGTVTITTSNNGIESEEVFVFNEQGLLERHNHSRSGRRDEYQYDFDERNGFRLVSKTDNKGNITRYEASYDAKGLLTELSYSNGTKLSYSYRDGVLEKITHYDRGEDIKTDYYDNNLKLVRSIRKGVTIVYKYNAEGDVASMSKMKGNIVMESTTYEYEYGTDGLWTKMTQYNNGDYLLTKMRQFEKPVSIKHEYSTPHKNEVETKPSNKVYDVVETMPQFPNGDVALMEYIRNNMRYPTVAEANGIQGRVIVTLVVERDGSITDVEVTKSVDPSLDQEAVRIVKNMPKWKPGTQNGKTVRVKYTIPVTFRLM